MSSSLLQPLCPSPSPSHAGKGNLSSLRFLNASVSYETHLLISGISQLCIRSITKPITTTIRMGGGPRTYPGGVSKWQWKRMQAKKAKQLLKARLCRERQIYEMRKRAELRAAVSELEKPWEVVERAPKLFSVSADEQLKALADRFQKPGGFDLWSDRDGPQLFHPAHGLPSARFFPKGVVHSTKSYGYGTTTTTTTISIAASEDDDQAGTGGGSGRSEARRPSIRGRFRSNGDDWVLDRSPHSKISRSSSDKEYQDCSIQESRVGFGISGVPHKKIHPRGSFGNNRRNGSPPGDFALRGRRHGGISGRQSNTITGRSWGLSRKSTVSPNRQRQRQRQRQRHGEEEAYEMNLGPDGRYEFQTNEQHYYEAGAGP